MSVVDEIDYNVEQIKQTIEGLVLAAQDEASKACQPFHDRTSEIRGQKRPKDWFKYAVTVRPEARADGTTRVRVIWMEMNWIKLDDGGAGKEWKLRGTYVKTNAKGRYSIGTFRKAGPEERALISATLDSLEKVYDTLKLAGSMKKSIANTYRKYQTT